MWRCCREHPCNGAVKVSKCLSINGYFAQSQHHAHLELFPLQYWNSASQLFLQSRAENIRRKAPNNTPRDNQLNRTKQQVTKQCTPNDTVTSWSCHSYAPMKKKTRPLQTTLPKPILKKQKTRSFRRTWPLLCCHSVVRTVKLSRSHWEMRHSWFV